MQLRPVSRQVDDRIVPAYIAAVCGASLAGTLLLVLQLGVKPIGDIGSLFIYALLFSLFLTLWLGAIGAWVLRKLRLHHWVAYVVTGALLGGGFFWLLGGLGGIAEFVWSGLAAGGVGGACFRAVYTRA